MEYSSGGRVLKNVASRNADLLGCSLIALDGNLLVASWKGGCYIPDRMVEQEEFLGELREEVCRISRISSGVEDYLTMLQLIPRRRSDARETRSHPEVRRLKRRSWGPDDTWSGQFIYDVEGANKQSPAGRDAHDCANGDRLKDRQPMKGFGCRGNCPKRIQQCLAHGPSEECACIESLCQRRRELMKMVAWFCEESSDYVHTEMVRSLFEAEMLLDVLLASRTPVLLTFRVNSPSEISITYQFLHTFKQDYMILKISKTHCMLMRAF